MCTKGPVPELYSCEADWKISLRGTERKNYVDEGGRNFAHTVGSARVRAHKGGCFG